MTLMISVPGNGDCLCFKRFYKGKIKLHPRYEINYVKQLYRKIKRKQNIIMIIFGRWTYCGYIIFPSESCIAHTLKNQIIWNKYFTNQFQMLEAGRKSAFMVFRLFLITMFKEALWVGASAHFFFNRISWHVTSVNRIHC